LVRAGVAHGGSPSFNLADVAPNGVITSGSHTVTYTPGDSFSIRANIAPGATQVRFHITGAQQRTENSAPYSLNGDSGTGGTGTYDAAPQLTTPGVYTMTVQPRNGNNIGTTVTVELTVVCAGCLP